MTVKVKYEYNLRLRMTGRYERRLAVRACEARQMGTADENEAVRVGLMHACARGVEDAWQQLQYLVRVRFHGRDLTVRCPRVTLRMVSIG